MEVLRKIRQQILVGRQMNDDINPAQRFRPILAVAHVARHAFDVSRTTSRAMSRRRYEQGGERLSSTRTS
jgi:hypothetical protein